MNDEDHEEDPGFHCDWCQEVEKFGPEEYHLVIQNYAADPEEFRFCTWACLARWVNT